MTLKISGKKAAMEMSVGTIVTIVLLISMLIIGIYFITKVKSVGGGAIDEVDSAVKSEINKLFSEDSTKKLIIYPKSREITIQKGTDGYGFALAIRNVGTEDDKFSYTINSEEASCGMKLSDADELIALNRERSNIQVGKGDYMVDPIHVVFNIPDTAPPCKISYSIIVEKDHELYVSSTQVILTVKGK